MSVELDDKGGSIQPRDLIIDVTRLLGRLMAGRIPTGVDRVSLEYVRHFADRSVALVRYRGGWVEISPTDSSRLFSMLLAPPKHFNLSVRLLITKAWWCSLLRSPKPQRLFLETGHNGLEQRGYAMRLKVLGVRTLFFVHDLIPITHPEYCRAGENERHQIRMDTVLTMGHGVVVNSESTLAELKAYADRSGHRMPPAVVAKLAPAMLPAPSASSPIATPYFVILGTIEPRKNHWMLLQVWRRLIDRLGSRAPKLVIIGQRGWECENVVDLLERCEALRGFVIERSSCSDAELATYLHHAQALLFPSFTEGYGIPLVEAISLSVPVIASDLAVFHEIAGDIPDYLDPLDSMAWLAKIEEFTEPNSAGRTAQRRRMVGFIVPGWVEHFVLVDNLINSLLEYKPEQSQRA